MRLTTSLILALALGTFAPGLKADDVSPVAADKTAGKAAAQTTTETGSAQTAAKSDAPLATLTVRLKDGQEARISLTHYDRFFLTGTNAKGTVLNIPWDEVAAVDSADAGGDLALMRGNINDEPSLVKSLIEPRSPGKAFGKALWPGLLLHGSGYRYDGYNDAFVNLAGAELFGVVVGIFGTYLQYYPDTSDTSKIVPKSLTGAGIAIFAATWAWDLAFSPMAAKDKNAEKGLAFEALPAGQGQGVQLSYHF